MLADKPCSLAPKSFVNVPTALGRFITGVSHNALHRESRTRFPPEGIIQPSHDENPASFFMARKARTVADPERSTSFHVVTYTHALTETMMNNVKLLGAAAMLMTALSAPALAQDRGGNRRQAE